jgi:hypothetical protein
VSSTRSEGGRIPSAAEPILNWLARPARCKVGLHDWRKTVDLDSDSAKSTLKVVCTRIGCNAESAGLDFIRRVQHTKPRAHT